MILIKNAYIKPMTSDDIPNGCILIDDNGKIASVGADICASDAEVIDAGGKLVTPGLIDGHCHSALSDRIESENNDHNEKSDPITPQMRAIDAFNPFSKDIADATSGGVTTICTGPGSANIIGGTFAAFKMRGTRADDMAIKNPVAMKCAFGENPKRFYGEIGKKAPFTRMGVAALLREFLFKAKAYCDDKESGKNPAFDIKLEAMIPVMKKEIPLKAHAHRTDDIFTAIRIAKEFDLKLTIEHCSEGHLIADELAKEGYDAFVGPTFGSKGKVETSNKSYSTASVLHNAGLRVSIITDSPVIPISHLAFCAGLSASEGLGETEAWKAVTINPAISLGIADRVGSIEPGKDADVVIWNANPITTVGAKPCMTIVDGVVVYEG